VVLATGASQRHAHACAEAVRWQLLEKARAELRRRQQQQQPDGDAPRRAAGAGLGAEWGDRLLPALRVAGGAASDWVALEAGTVVVHVFTERARAYYDIEGLWGAPGRVLAVRPGAAAGRVMTKDTIR
jgi:ribosomal silencing factor RsfS